MMKVLYVTQQFSFSLRQNTKKKLDMCVQFGDLFFVLYSTTDRASFQEAERVARQIATNKFLEPTAALFLIATKTDLTHLRAVDEFEGRFLAQDLDCGFYEVSISEGYEQTHDLLKNAIHICLGKIELEKHKGSPLSRVKGGLIGTARSLSRKKSSSSESFFDPHSSSSYELSS